jgi:iron complex outermembrane receptor protein
MYPVSKNLLFIALILLGLLATFGLKAQNDSLRVYELGTVRIEASSAKTDSSGIVTLDEMEKMNRLTVSESVNMLSGIVQSSIGPRNESLVFVRGFDLRQVPLFIDGIPVYVPFDGYADLNRFTVFDLSQIHVSKGGSSVLYGANTMGGAINLVSQKPESELDVNGNLGWLSGGRKANINLGSRQKMFYAQLGLSHYQRDYFPLSQAFQSTVTESGERRDNAYHRDNKLSLKVGLTPNSSSEYSLAYTLQRGEKGSPVYTGSDTLNPQFSRPRYWQWPYWNKESLYFISRTGFGAAGYLKVRLFYDEFDNKLESFDDETYSSQDRPYAFTSIYDDYTLGGSLEWGIDTLQNHFIKLAAHYKKDVHREFEPELPEITLSDYTASFGLEDVIDLSDELTMIVGLNWNSRGSIRADQLINGEVGSFPENESQAINGQFNLNYELLSGKGSLFAMAARKTRFATLKDRYSFRLGVALPNPDLLPEHAWNFELGARYFLSSNLSIRPAVFYSAIDDVIQLVNNVTYDPESDTWLDQQQNTGRARYYGLELPISYRLKKGLRTGVNYSFIKRENITNPDIFFTDVPEHQLLAYISLTDLKDWDFNGSLEYNSERYSTAYGTTTNQFTLFNVKVSRSITRIFSLEAGINNLFDSNYAFVEGYPEPGRNFFFSLVFDYSK